MKKEEEIVRLHQEAYDRVAPYFEENVVPLFRPLAERLIELARIQPGEQVLDIGTGTGLAALLAAPMVGKTGYVLGIDVSEGMLAIARRKAPHQHFPSVEFRQMDARALDLPSGSFDMVVSSFGLPFSHPAPVLEEVHRLLRNGGRLVFQEWGTPQEGDDQAGEAFRRVLEKYRLQKLTGWAGRFRRAREASWDIWESLEESDAIAKMVKEAGFSRVEVFEEQHPTFLPSAEAYWNLQNSWASIRSEVEALSERRRKAFKQEVLRALAPLVSKKGILLPWAVIRVRGFKA
ncbi:MAG: methyltransferase domain-containing protein [Chloroflexi bacterium]|nr:methyltransferase domain-containing protein [Chloroflexota bacterium]